MDPLLYTVPETAQITRTSRSVIYELIRTGRLASIKIGNSRRVPHEAITDFIASLSADDTV